MNKDDGAFAAVNDGSFLQTGLTKQEYLAGLAMQGLLSGAGLSPYSLARDEDMMLAVVTASRRYADALIRNLNGEF
jgi:hypothetical protein